MGNKLIDDLPAATQIPGPGELVVPVFSEGTNQVLHRLPIADLVSMIREGVLAGGGITLVETEHGIKFIQDEASDGNT